MDGNNGPQIIGSRLKREIRELIQNGNKSAAINKIMWHLKCRPIEAVKQLRNLII